MHFQRDSAGQMGRPGRLEMPLAGPARRHVPTVDVSAKKTSRDSDKIARTRILKCDTSWMCNPGDVLASRNECQLSRSMQERPQNPTLPPTIPQRSNTKQRAFEQGAMWKRPSNKSTKYQYWQRPSLKLESIRCTSPEELPILLIIAEWQSRRRTLECIRNISLVI